MERTERDIVQAFNRLLAHKGVEKITTQMIADEAGVSRATFYRYFHDKYDVLNHNYKKLLDDCVAACSNYRDLFCALYRHAQTEWTDFHRAFSTTGVNSLANYVYSYSRGVVEEITRQNRGGEGLTEAEELQVDVVCYGISYMYEKWTLGQYPLTPDEAADALFAVMPESLRGYWFLEGRDTP